MSIKVVRTVKALREAVAEWHRDGQSVALVPTMGALHEGHLALVREGRKRADQVMASIFVNPTQFAANEDFGSYPRQEQEDIAKLEQAGAALAFVPDVKEMYGENFSTTVTVAGPATAGLEDRFRPHFFNGVATVVAKLFNQSRCDMALFGEKDYQQLLVVRQMARDLDIGCEVIGCETIRESDGLAMSSRNAYLSAEERQTAPLMHQVLQAIASRVRRGDSRSAALAEGVQRLTDAGFVVDYVELRDAETLAPEPEAGRPLRLLAAAKLGRTRLIDNIAV